MSESRVLYRNSCQTILTRVMMVLATGMIACPAMAQSQTRALQPQAKSMNPFKKIAAMLPAGSGVSQASYRAPQVPQLPNVQIPNMQVPQLNIPNGGQLQMPQVPQLGQLKVPQLGQMPALNAPQYPNINLPSGQGILNSMGLGSQAQSGPLGLVNKWNQSVNNFMAKAKQKLTLPQLKLPQLGGALGGTQQGGGLFSGLTQPQTPVQPATVQNWLGQARPQ